MNKKSEKATSRIIVDSKGRRFTIKIDIDSFHIGERTGHPIWSVNYTVNNAAEENVGFGSFAIEWQGTVEELPTDDEVFESLLGNGSEKVKDDINAGESIESKGYHMYVDHR